MQDDLVGEKRGGMGQVVSSGSGRLGGPVQLLKPAGQPTLLSPQVRTSCFFTIRNVFVFAAGMLLVVILIVVQLTESGDVGI
jgi:hypothetical protein